MARKKPTGRKGAARKRPPGSTAKAAKSKASTPKAGKVKLKAKAKPAPKHAGRRTAARSPGKTRRPTRDLLGPPPAEATILRGDRARALDARLRAETATSPRLTGGDLDADWGRAASVGEEAVGGSVATPDQDIVDELGEALGVPRAPDEPVKSSQEILEARDARRILQEG
jgi:uncharacterized protein DUF6335